MISQGRDLIDFIVEDSWDAKLGHGKEAKMLARMTEGDRSGMW
jgi:hypothetical protein